MKKILSAGLLVLALGPMTWAQDAPPPVRTVLPNGIPLIVQESYSSPTVSLNIFIRVGSVYEDPRYNGISHFYEHMFFRGTPTRTGLEFKRAIESLGGITNATTGRDYTHFYINLPKQYLRKGLELLADAYINAECSLDSVEAERKVVLEEYNLGLNHHRHRGQSEERGSPGVARFQTRLLRALTHQAGDHGGSRHQRSAVGVS